MAVREDDQTVYYDNCHREWEFLHCREVWKLLSFSGKEASGFHR